MRHLQQAGLSLVETVLVLLVASIILGGVWVGYAQIRLTDQVNRTVIALDQTLQNTRDYLAGFATVPSATGATNSLSYILYNKGLMPVDLSYTGTTSASLAGLTGGTQVFRSPLGHDFFVQSIGATNVFEVRIGFTDVQNKFSFANQCLALMPKIIGNSRMIKERGLVGYWYGGNYSWNKDYSSGSTAGSGPNGAGTTNRIATWSADVANNAISATTQRGYCNANDVRLYFSIR